MTKQIGRGFIKTLNTTFQTRKLRLECDLTEEDIHRLPSMILTKRTVFGLVMSQYDPMGRKNPLTIILKINLKNLFAPDTNLGRDDVIPPGFCKTWVDILTTFLRMGEITLSRAVKSERTVGRPIIIRFADGSLDANGCSIYI